MACHISVRDIDFHASTTGVRIRATTDVPSHLFVRLSSQEPLVHRKPSIRRGVAFAEDVRFCFTVFEDNEQFESGDTLEHTWWKTNWPPCTTKWLYIWGLRAGETCVSTTAPFKYHNDGTSPLPVPEAMYQLNPIDPQYYTFPGGGAWQTCDLSRDIPEDATGAVFQLHNIDSGAERRLALRKPGCTYEAYMPMMRDGALWVIVGLDAARKFEYRFQSVFKLDGYLMGYTGRDVVFPDTPLDIKPDVNNAYKTVNIAGDWPDAKILLTDMGSEDSLNTYHSIRPDGSSKEIYQDGWRKFPFTGVSGGGSIQTKLYQRGNPTTKWLAYAYIKEDCSYSLDGIDFAGFTANAWKALACGGLNPASRWAFLEYYHPFSSVLVGARKEHSYFNFLGRSSNHGYFITHLHHDFKSEVWSGNTAEQDQLMQIAETH